MYTIIHSLLKFAVTVLFWERYDIITFFKSSIKDIKTVKLNVYLKDLKQYDLDKKKINFITL